MGPRSTEPKLQTAGRSLIHVSVNGCPQLQNTDSLGKSQPLRPISIMERSPRCNKHKVSAQVVYSASKRGVMSLPCLLHLCRMWTT